VDKAVGKIENQKDYANFIEIEMAPGGGNQFHSHLTCDEPFEILEGTLEVHLGKTPCARTRRRSPTRRGDGGADRAGHRRDICRRVPNRDAGLCRATARQRAGSGAPGRR
jgi:hypothetical protein